jgi:hypothetical protein
MPFGFRDDLNKWLKKNPRYLPVVQAKRDPVGRDRNYAITTIWWNAEDLTFFILRGFAGGDALWSPLFFPAGDMVGLIADSTNVVPDVNGFITMESPDGSINWTAGTNTVNGVVVPGPILDNLDFVTDSGTASPAGGEIDITGGTGISTSGATNVVLFSLDVPVVEIHGGTGQTTYATGDTLYASGTNTLAKRPIGNEGEVYTVVAGVPDWAPAPITTLATNQTNGQGTYNLGFFYDSGTGVATIKGADGNDLDADNPGYVTIRSGQNPGELLTFTLTSNFTFEDANGSASVFDGSLFSFDSGDETNTWSPTGSFNAIPFYLYVAIDNTDDNPVFVCSRTPGRTALTSTISQPGAGNATFDRNFQLLQTVADVSDYQNRTALMIGCFAMRLNGSDDWEIVASDPLGGIGRYYERANFAMPTGVAGSRTNSVFADNGGTAPETVNQPLTYRIDPFNSICHWQMEVSTSGMSGAVTAVMRIPIVGDATAISASFWGSYQTGGGLSSSLTTRQSPVLFIPVTPSTSGFNDGRYFALKKGDGTSASWLYDDFVSGTRVLKAQISYRF